MYKRGGENKMPSETGVYHNMPQWFTHLEIQILCVGFFFFSNRTEDISQTLDQSYGGVCVLVATALLAHVDVFREGDDSHALVAHDGADDQLPLHLPHVVYVPR